MLISLVHKLSCNTQDPSSILRDTGVFIKETQATRAAHIMDAVIVGLIAAAVMGLAVSILLPTLAIPLVTSAMIGLGASIHLSSTLTGLLIAALSLIPLTGCMMFAAEAQQDTDDINHHLERGQNVH